MNLGIHFARNDEKHPPNTPTLDLTYLIVPSGDLHSIGNTMKRVEAYAARHPKATVVWRIDYSYGGASFHPTDYDLKSALEPLPQTCLLYTSPSPRD